MRNYKGRVVINRRTGKRGIVQDVDDNKRLIVSYEGAEPKKYAFMFVIDEGIICFEDDQDQQAAKAWVQHERELKQREDEMRRQEQMADIKAEEEKSRSRKSRRIGVSKENVIYKATYCDGGATKERIGYAGICSPEAIKNNVEAKRRWCSDHECICYKYYSGEITYDELEDSFYYEQAPCYDSVMFIDWQANAGNMLTKKSRDKAKKISSAKEGGLCILTTRLPGTREEDRIIIGLFLIDEVYTGDDDYSPSSGTVQSHDERFRLELTKNEAANMRLWRFYANQKSPSKAKWGTGLIRYCEDEIAVQILKDAVSLKQGTKDEKLANDFLDEYCNRNKVDPSKVGAPNGALTLV